MYKKWSLQDEFSSPISFLRYQVKPVLTNSVPKCPNTCFIVFLEVPVTQFCSKTLIKVNVCLVNFPKKRAVEEANPQNQCLRCKISNPNGYFNIRIVIIIFGGWGLEQRKMHWTLFHSFAPNLTQNFNVNTVLHCFN